MRCTGTSHRLAVLVVGSRCASARTGVTSCGRGAGDPAAAIWPTWSSAARSRSRGLRGKDGLIVVLEPAMTQPPRDRAGGDEDGEGGAQPDQVGEAVDAVPRPAHPFTRTPVRRALDHAGRAAHAPPGVAVNGRGKESQWRPVVAPCHAHERYRPLIRR